MHCRLVNRLQVLDGVVLVVVGVVVDWPLVVDLSTRRSLVAGAMALPGDLPVLVVAAVVVVVLALQEELKAQTSIVSMEILVHRLITTANTLSKVSQEILAQSCLCMRMMDLGKETSRFKLKELPVVWVDLVLLLEVLLQF